VTGLNPHYRPARNPYDPTRATGGSSSGPAAVVSAGLCPIAVGADGGGSIRIPASLCGVTGIKATFGRVSEHGAATVCWSVAHVGPIAASVRDLALAYGVMAGPDDHDANSLAQPTPTLDGIDRRDLRDVRLGVYTPWFEDADRDVVRACREALDALVSAGARVVEIDVPELNLLRTVHMVTIVSEMTAAHLQLYSEHRDQYGHDVRFNLALGRALQTYDYVHAQRLRVRLARQFDRVLTECDAIVTPSTACTAPRLAPDALETGESDTALLDRIMHGASMGRATALPPRERRRVRGRTTTTARGIPDARCVKGVGRCAFAESGSRWLPSHRSRSRSCSARCRARPRTDPTCCRRDRRRASERSCTASTTSRVVARARASTCA
jgi:Asp-tRNA(Asn)/Glu-tRNA(Gln) amidotransferase A subunit family amidase